MINSFIKNHKTNYHELNYEMIEGKFEKEEMILCPTTDGATQSNKESMP